MHPRLLLYGVVILLMAGACGIGYYIPQSNAESQRVEPSENKNEPLIMNDEVEITISTFLNQLLHGRMEEAQRYTTGDVYQILQSNEKQKVSGHLLDHGVRFLFANDHIAQAKVDATVQTTMGSDRHHYLYDLIKQNGQWKIYRIEEVPLMMEPHGIEEGNVPSVIKEYLSKVALGQWQESLLYLAGPALMDVQKTFTFLPKHYRTELTIQNETLIAENPGMIWVLAKYEVLNPEQKKVLHETVFQLEEINGEWKITQISNVTTGGK